MRFLRRNSEPAEVSPEPTQRDIEGASPTVGKGRPTPKRREAEGRRRGPVAPPPRTQREAFRRARGTRPSKEERRAARLQRREAMLSGDDRFLLPRDRGPVRAYVRDLVDSRRQLMGLFMPMAFVVLLTLFVQDVRIKNAVSLLTMAMLATMVVETLFLGRFIAKQVKAKFPDAEAGGLSLTFYAFTRATMMRRFRTPRPRVGYGQLPR